MSITNYIRHVTHDHKTIKLQLDLSMSVSAGLECFTQETMDYVQLWLFRVLAPLGLLSLLVLLGFVTRLDRDRMVQ